MKQAITNIAKKVLPNNIRVFLRKVNWKIKYIAQTSLNKSNGIVVDPVSDDQYKRFIQIKKEKISPGNGAKSRQRLVWLFLENETDIFRNKIKLLHVAPEYSYFKEFKKFQNIEYFPGDKMEKGYSNQQGIQQLDLTGIHFQDNYFDYVLCNHVLEHIPDDKKAMSEIYRVLIPGGRAIITIPINEKLEKTLEDPSIKTAKDRQKYYGQWDHVRYYAPDVKDKLQNAGFKVIMHRYAEKFSKEEYLKFGLCDDIIIEAIK
ncbi:MAG: class I SAM-dependent methyltransferase [Chitinophagales bacterium]